jgi:3',5'-cyclic AMP phosphodiesterase CpdA
VPPITLVPLAALERYGKRTQAKGTGWYSFDKGGVHFVGLVNVANLKAGGKGSLGAEQLAWLADDLKAKSASTPIVLFAHIPFWTVAADWGWGTDDSVQALGLVKRFGSVTVLNGTPPALPPSRSPRPAPRHRLAQ